MRVEPVSEHPPASSRTLVQWLDEGYSAQTGPDASTRLREIADTRALLAAMWAALLSLGASAVLFFIVVFSVAGPLSFIGIAVGAALAAVSAGMLRAGARRIPTPGRTLTTRGPGTLRGGLLATGGILLVVNVFLIPAAVSSDSIPAVWVVDLVLVLLLVSVFVVPGAVLGRSRATMRRRLARDPQLMRLLEQERLHWTPRPGTPMFGPL